MTHPSSPRSARPDGPLEALQAWYHAQCDGDWEHDFGVQIETLDNPGWSLRVALTGTALEHAPFEPIDRSADGDRWIVCRIQGGNFEAFGGPATLSELIGIFTRWAATHGARETS